VVSLEDTVTVRRAIVVAVVSCLVAVGLTTVALAQQPLVDYKASADAKFRSGDLEGAVADITRAIGANPKDAELLSGRAFLNIHLGNLDAAMSDLSLATVLEPKNAGHYALRGAVKHRQGDLDGAIADSQRAVDLDAKALLAYETIVQACFQKIYGERAAMPASTQQQLIKTGVQAADRGLRIDPINRDVLAYKGLLLRMQAALETDASKQNALISEANALREKMAQGRSRDFLPPVAPPPPPPPPAGAGVTGGVIGSIPPAPPPPPPPPSAPVRVGAEILPPKKVKDVAPVYPAIAQQARIQGLVFIEAVIGPTGKVTEAKIVRGNALLNEAALAAVRQWEYTPTLVNNVPVSVIMTVTVSFALK
jgi:TonB family protein